MNRLASESSPYLLQHKNNPVEWYPWGEEAFERARTEDKLVLVSIGYSACHWCHVMEHESFEDEEIARFMNRHFVNIKVDREERPDIDQVYMSAVQLMTQRGGWPLNCFVLPNGKPFYGGTYFPKDQWLHIMKQLVHIQENEPDKLVEYSEKLTEGVAQTELLTLAKPVDFNSKYIGEAISKWGHQFDWKEGGMNRAPKFPMPTNYDLLQYFGEHTSNAEILEFLDLTLTKMARGGIYDQLGGGFCRYSVDGQWKVPHFEKMLYDNGQLLSLYSMAYLRTGSEEYREVIDGIIEFMDTELLCENGGLFAALDADSEGVEGKYYIWSREEPETVLGDDFSFTEDYFNINEYGYWEEGNYILLRRRYDAPTEQLLRVKKALLDAREKRIKPGLDDKIICSWNALAVIGLADAYRATHDEQILTRAMDCIDFILSELKNDEGRLFHTFQKGEAKVDGFLEDYAFCASALIKIFEATSEENYLHEAHSILEYAIENFFDETNGLFNFTNKNGEQLIAAKQEISDNVIPASNSEMAHALFKCGNYFAKPAFIAIARQMVSNVWELIPNYPAAYSNWAILGLKFEWKHREIVVSGTNSEVLVSKLKKLTSPYVTVLNCSKKSELPVFKARFQEDETSIFVCTDGSCLAPVASVEEALGMI